MVNDLVNGRSSQRATARAAMGRLGFYTTATQALQGADLSGKTAVVTGGNSGIGAETVRALALAGARVLLLSRSIEAGEKVASSIKAEGALVSCHPCGTRVTCCHSLSRACQGCPHALQVSQAFMQMSAAFCRPFDAPVAKLAPNQTMLGFI